MWTWIAATAALTSTSDSTLVSDGENLFFSPHPISDISSMFKVDAMLFSSGFSMILSSRQISASCRYRDLSFFGPLSSRIRKALVNVTVELH